MVNCGATGRVLRLAVLHCIDVRHMQEHPFTRSAAEGESKPPSLSHAW